MTRLLDIVREDFRAAKKAFEAAEYELMNIFANRLMGNALYAEPKKLLLPGFFMKEIATDLLRLRKDASELAKAKEAALECISAIESAFPDENVKVSELWDAYHEYVSKTASLVVTGLERSVYHEARDFTSNALKKLINDCLLGAGMLSGGSLNTVKGVLHEIGRIARNHGIEKRDLPVWSIITAYDRLHDYFLQASFEPSGSLNREELKRVVEPFREKISRFAVTWQDASQDVFEPAAGLLCEIVLEWRKYFVLFLESAKVTVTREEKRVELPEETKKKLGERIAEAFEKDLGRGKSDKGKKK